MKSFAACFILLIACFSFSIRKSFAQCNEDEIISLRKIAIVFGESNYKYKGPLSNPFNDARDIARSLRNVGFTVYPYYDDDRKAMDEHVNSWFDQLKNYDVALFYFSGHGAEVNGYNYLFPVDANPKGQTELMYGTFSASQMLARLENSNLKYSVVILDACRNNPFIKAWPSRDATEKGLVSMSAKKTFVGLAAAPGETASDGDSGHSPYTESILKYITKPGLTIDEIFTRVNADVEKSTLGIQSPSKTSRLGSDYCFSVRRSPKQQSKIRSARFEQPKSDIILSPDEQYIITLGDNGETISVREANTMNILSSNKSDGNHLSAIAIKTDSLLFIADSSRQVLKVLDWQKQRTIDSTRLDFKPLSVINTLDNKKIYVCGNDKGNGVVSVINPIKYVTTKSYRLPNEIVKAVLSSDGKYLYVISKATFKKLYVIDLKYEKITELEQSDMTGALGISPNDKKLYIGTTSKGIEVIELPNYLSPHFIQTSATEFAFTEDSKLMFAMSKNKITVIDCSSDEPLYDYSVASSPKGAVITSDGYIHTWLPDEDNIFSFHILDSTRMSNASRDSEQKLKNFSKKLNNNEHLRVIKDYQTKKRDSCSLMTAYATMLYATAITPTIQKLSNDLNNENYKAYGSGGPQCNCDEKIFDYQDGVHSLLEGKNLIHPTFRLIFQPTNIELRILDGDHPDKNISKFQIPLSSIRQLSSDSSNPFDSKNFALELTVEAALKKMVREYFINKIEYLDK